LNITAKPERLKARILIGHRAYYLKRRRQQSGTEASPATVATAMEITISGARVVASTTRPEDKHPGWSCVKKRLLVNLP
jgi:hypothetical protein